MFKSGQPNPYDDIVNKTTDENLTGENWELILNLCDKVQDEGEQGARNVVAAVLKRLAHRNPNVQLYALSLAESLSKNCGVELHRELASRAFTQGLEKIITDRNSHEKVKRRALVLIAQWTAEFENDPTLGIMEECYNNLKSKNYKFEAPQEPLPPTVDDEIRRKEEEELQRVLEMSVQDKGGRGQWTDYSGASSSRAAASSSNTARNASTTAAAPAGHSSSSSRPANSFAAPKYQAGYVPARTPSPKAQPPPSFSAATATAAPTIATPEPVAQPAPQAANSVVTRVRALHTFEPTEPGELAFDKGDIIKVVDRGYKDWWRGQLKGRTGIFPVNYVEPMPEPTAAELAKEAEQEASVFMQAANVDKLLTMLRDLDPAKDNLADNEEIQELYRSSMALRPKIVKLIDKYSQKRADLVSMNESFVKARTIFDRMMEDSLAKHSAFYEQSRPAYAAAASSYQGRPDSRARHDAGPQPYGWNSGYDQPGYPAYPTPAPGPGYPQPDRGYQGPPQPQPQSQPQQYIDPNAYAQAPQVNYVQPYPPQATPGVSSPYPGGQPAQQQQQQPQPAPQQGPQQQFPVSAQQVVQQTLQTAQPQVQPQQSPIMQAQQPQQAQPQAQTQAQPQPQAQQQSPPQQQSGPPYVYDANGTYADPNVQAWATYYAQGGQDLAGAVYFISIPGVTDGPPQPEPHFPAESIQPLHIQHHDSAPAATQAQAGGQPSFTPGGETAGYTSQPASAITSGGLTSHVGGNPSSQPPWAQAVPHEQSLSNPGSPAPHQPIAGSPTPHSFPAAGTPQQGAPPAGWQGQYNGIAGQMGAMDISGGGEGVGQPQTQLPYPGPA